MARDPHDESMRKHKDWLGYLQPVGLVVSPPALADADCHVNTDVMAEYQRFVASTTVPLLHGRVEAVPAVKELQQILVDIFGWNETDLVAGSDPLAADLNVYLEGYDDHLMPSFAVIDDPKASPAKWLMLVQEIPVGLDFDKIPAGDNRKWQATPQARFERLLRETQVPTGLLSNGVALRLVYSPRGESPGHITFPVPIMLETAGRPVFAALLMLLRESRVFGSTGGKTLYDILAASRKYQNTVSTELAQQVLAALYELLRGFQAADAQRKGELLAQVLAKDPNQVYAGQLTVLLRLVFLLYAEDRGLMSDSEVYVRYYSVSGLFDKLRGDAGRHPDTMDQRYGAWARLVTLFRMVHDGAKGGGIQIPARHGYLFDPDRYPFLEGRAHGSMRDPGERITPPLVSDGVVFRVLHNLMILNGERLSYRALDVEQIGSVYEAMMGFRIEKATGRSIAVKPKKPHGAPVTIDLEALLAESGDKRGKWFLEKADRKLTPKEAAALKVAKTPEDVVALLDRKVAKAVTPNIVPSGSMVLQPSDERRRSGSHYTPRSLTEPIVRKALEPILRELGDNLTTKQILALKICDPAMGSGAFLVEVSRQLGELLVKSWHVHNQLPKIPPDEDELLHAQRLVAQRCLYGVDKNPMAVDLAKLSLWLTTLAKDHPFTFIDHSLRSGDSLVGLTRKQLIEFHWLPCKQRILGQDVVEERIKSATAFRQKILDAGEYFLPGMKESQLKYADEALNTVRFAGNLVIAAFFAADKDKARIAKRDEYLSLLSEYLSTGNVTLRPTKQEAALLTGEKSIQPFHWEIEFPEVFGHKDGGFDCIVGNPPYLTGKDISGTFGSPYLGWLLQQFAGFSGNSDIVALFFRQGFSLLRSGGTLGFIATNTIAQGDTRQSGLKIILANENGHIYDAVKRCPWPGQASVVASIVHISKQMLLKSVILNGRNATSISAYLANSTNNDDPRPLYANHGKCFQGSIVLGMGFTFDDHDSKQVASTITDMKRLLESNPINSKCIFPYIGSEEVNNDPRHLHSRYVIDFGDRTVEEAASFPDLFSIVASRVKPERDKLAGSYKQYWWRYGRSSKEGRLATKELSRVLVTTCSATPHLSLAFLPQKTVYANSLDVFAYDSYAAFCNLQSRIHETWARFFTSSFKDDLRYAPTDCFENYPFPTEFALDLSLELAGKAYYELRADLMIRNDQGLTKTYNRFHDPNEQDPNILKLREMHEKMDRAVLTAYGSPFSELIVPPCEFLLDYEDDEEDEEETGKRQKKKPWRYRWPDAFRDEVLAMLLELNKQRAEAEQKAAGSQPKAKPNPRRTKKNSSNESQGDLF